MPDALFSYHGYVFRTVVLFLVLVNQDTLVMEGRDLVAVLYSYRSCVKALPQVCKSCLKTWQPLNFLRNFKLLCAQLSCCILITL